MKTFHTLLIALGMFAAQAFAADIRLLSDRNNDYFKSVLEAFTAKTGKTVEVVTGSWSDLKDGLSKGETGDLLLVKDIVYIGDAKQAGVFQKMSDANLKAGVPAYMRDPEGLWTAVSYRVRTLVYNPDEVDPSQLPTYESLSNPEFRGRVCIRNRADYMPSMVAWLVARYGEVKAREIVTGWQANLAMYTARDTETITKVEDGTCAVGISNHYYYARVKSDDPRLVTELLFTNQNDGGVHTNGFGGGVLASASNPDGANELLAFILSSEGSSLMIQAPSYEYPAVATNRPSSMVESFGPVVSSDISWNDIFASYGKGMEILESVGWQ